MSMIVTIDGPTASGKSSVSRIVAHQLGFSYVCSGLLYRALACVAIAYEKKTAGDAVRDIALWCPREDDVVYTHDASGEPCVRLYGTVYTLSTVKTALIDVMASRISACPEIREVLRKVQRAYAFDKNVIVEGRDAGTVVFPDAECKLFLTAETSVRASRWREDQRMRGALYSEEESLRAVMLRDARDTARACAPLQIPKDAYIIDGTEKSMAEVVSIVCSKILFQCHNR